MSGTDRDDGDYTVVHYGARKKRAKTHTISHPTIQYTITHPTIQNTITHHPSYRKTWGENTRFAGKKYNVPLVRFLQGNNGRKRWSAKTQRPQHKKRKRKGEEKQAT
jgi:hypothetical protein